MTGQPLFSGPLFSALAWALFHFLWQGTVVAAVFAALGIALRKQAPSVRYATACAALGAMLALPVATAWSAAGSAVSPGSVPTRNSGVAATESSAVELRISEPIDSRAELLSAVWRGRVESLRPWALSVWFAGVLLLSIRFVGGLAAARRLTRRRARRAPPEWQHTVALIAARLSVTRPVELLESAIVRVPTAIGALRPAILLPASVFTGLPVRGLEALIAHELAHVRRHDYLVNLLQTVVETLLFYHPAVWWISARVRAEREQCCDDLAIAATGDPRSYARALVRLEEMRGNAPALAVAASGGNLWYRVVRVLEETRRASEREGEGSSRWVAGALVLGMLFAVGAVARIGPADWESENPAETASIDAVAPDAVVSPAPAREKSAEEDSTALREEEDDQDAGGNEEAENDEGAAEDADADDDPPAESAGSRQLTTDELIAFRTHGVTAEFVRSIAALGYDRADPDDILALKIHGVTAGDIAEMNRLFGRTSLGQHAAFKIHGVDAESVRRLSALGLGKIGADEALAARIHGVDTRFVEALRAAGFRRLSMDDVVAAKIHGVDPADAAVWTRLGYPSPSLEDLVAARIHRVTAEFVSEIRSLGFERISLEDLVAFRIHGVTPEFVREVRSTGLARLTDEDAVAFRIHGVTAQFVREIRALGYPEASADELVGVRIHGMSAEDVRKANSLAGRRVPLEELVDEKDWEEDHDED